MDDEVRFTGIFKEFHARVTAYARRRVPAEIAQDVVAATFVAAWRHLDELPDDPLPWLYQAAAWQISAQRRNARRRTDLHQRVSEDGPALAADDVANQVANADRWKAAFASLTEVEREVLRLVAWEGLSPTQAAAALGCSVPAFKVRLHRARRRLEAMTRVDPPRRVADTSHLAPSSGPPTPHPDAFFSLESLPQQSLLSPRQEA